MDNARIAEEIINLSASTGSRMSTLARVFKLESLLTAILALLSAGASQAKPDRTPNLIAGDWQIAAVSKGRCAMKRLYPATAREAEEGLIVAYDAQRKAAALTWVSRKPKLPPLGGSLSLDLSFFGGSAKNQQWGSQLFQTEKRADSYGFTHVFASLPESDRFLRDLAAHDTFALFLGPVLMTGLPLNASEAIAKLRECSSTT